MTTKEIQEWLCLHGLKVAIDGVMGPSTKAAIKQFQGNNRLERSGVVDTITATLLAHPLAAAGNLAGMTATTFADAVLSVAKHYLRYHPQEIGGQNRGPWVRSFMLGHEGDSYPWCAGAVSTILSKADTVFHGNPFAYTMSCDNLADQAQRKGRFTSMPSGLQAGSIFLIRGKQPNDWIHTGIVTAFNADHFTTIEGNTNDEGSREGYEMCARIRSYRNVDFVRL